jgi:Skp family chaperone for outer membrane proteins
MNKQRKHLRSFEVLSKRIALSVALLGCASTCFAQQPASPVAAQQAAEVSPAAPASVDVSKPMSPKQKQLTDDTAKLQILANELKAEMDKSSKDTLSLTVIKKAEEVEKLAHKVEAEMKANLMN